MHNPVLCCLLPWCVFAQSRTAALHISSSHLALLGSPSDNQCIASNADWSSVLNCPGCCCHLLTHAAPLLSPESWDLWNSLLLWLWPPLSYKPETFLPTRDAQKWMQAKYKMLGWLLPIIIQWALWFNFCLQMLLAACFPISFPSLAS